jgi:hypothetical protein
MANALDPALDPRSASALRGRGSRTSCAKQSMPLGRSGLRLCNDLVVLPVPRFDVGSASAPPKEGV